LNPSRQFFNLALNRIAHRLTRSVVSVLLPGPKKASQAVTPLSGYYVNVQVWHCLANAIVNCYERPFRTDRGLHSFG
jgi:hypothetical protein